MGNARSTDKQITVASYVPLYRIEGTVMSAYQYTYMSCNKFLSYRYIFKSFKSTNSEFWEILTVC